MPNVNLQVTGFQTTGSNVNFPQYEVSIEAQWTNQSGPQSRTGVELFPNILNDPGLSNAWLKKNLTKLVLDAVREIEGF